MTRKTSAEETAEADIYAEVASGDGSTVEYTCDEDGCPNTFEVAEESLSIAGGDMYCDECKGGYYASEGAYR